MKKDFDATLVRAACNLLSGVPAYWMADSQRETVVQAAVRTARDVVAEIERTTPTLEHPEPDTVHIEIADAAMSHALKKRIAELYRDIAHLRDRLHNPMGEGYAPDIYSKDLQKIIDGTYSEEDDE